VNSLRCHGSEVILTELFSQTIECVISQNFSVDAVLHAAAPWPNHQDQLASRSAAQKPLD